MKLYYSNTSPYSRKVRLVALEKGLKEKIQWILVNPFEQDKNLAKVNPLGKIPALVLDNGETLFDSPVIAHYLDSLNNNKPLIPNDGSKWTIFRWEALADGVIDAAYNIVIETRREDAQQSEKWLRTWKTDIKRALNEMEKGISQLGKNIQLSHLAVGTAIGYLTFRVPECLPKKNAQLYNWYKNFKNLESFKETTPFD